ncbi:hypothetical protein ACP26L_25750 [Paenibacillus sp. S-38]
MYRLTFNGRPFGSPYHNEQAAWGAYLRMRQCIQGLWYKKVDA